MDAIAFWATPLLLLPGAGLLVVSTSARYAQLYGEFSHHLAAEPPDAVLRAHMLHRARLFRNALVLLYGCIALFAVAGLIGHALVMDVLWAQSVVAGLTCIGILALAVAAALLVRESFLSVEGLEALARSFPPHPSSHG